MSKKYDAIIIGAGMSGMAAGIRLGMYDKKVCILEKHTIGGGLNSFYQRGKRKFDVGLHAMTNFVPKGSKGHPLTKLCKQLRIPYDELKLNEQSHSKVIFPENNLAFTNNIDVLIEEIHREFPDQVDGFRKLIFKIENFNEVSLENEQIMAKDVVRNYISNSTLLEMIFCPLLIYGSAWENDMDFSQFVIMFKSIFLEGFSRPEGGVRTIINLLEEKLEASNCELKYRTGVNRIISKNGKVVGVETTKGEILETDCLISSAGLPETMNMLEEEVDNVPRVGKLSFTETIIHTEKKPIDMGIKETIVFFNNRPEYLYRRPDELFDNQSAVICMPNNFQVDDFDEGCFRLTNMANFGLWNDLPKDIYKQKKNEVYENSLQTLKNVYPKFEDNVLFKDVFSPTTIKKYTGHLSGTVYGSPDKSRNGSTHVDGLYICGTDQGFLGIVGSMLSGISMANLYGLMK